MNRQFFIAGVQFHDLPKVANAIKETFDNLGGYYNLMLVPEPTNKFDPNAVAIKCVENNTVVMLGYVPKKFSSEVSAMIEAGVELECLVTAITPSAKPWEMCSVVIKDVVPKDNSEYEEDGSAYDNVPEDAHYDLKDQGDRS